MTLFIVGFLLGGFAMMLYVALLLASNGYKFNRENGKIVVKDLQGNVLRSTKKVRLNG